MRRVLVAGIGNIFRTDDGFGPAVAARLRDLPAGVRVVDYGIRGLHLAYDLLADWDALVLIDALPNRGAAGRVSILHIGPGDIGRGDIGPGDIGPGDVAGAVDAHGMDPATVLSTVDSLGGRLPERTLLVGCQVGDAGDGMGLTPPVQAAVDEAASTVRSLVAGLEVG